MMRQKKISPKSLKGLKKTGISSPFRIEACLNLKKTLQLLVFAIAISNLNPTISFSQNADINLLHSINSNNSTSWDNTNKIFSQSMTPVSVAVPTVMFLYGIIKHDSLTTRKSFVAGAGLLTSTIITIGLKISVKRPRPFVTYPNLIQNKSAAGSPSFPSGHTSSAFATATSLSLLYPKWYVIAPSFLWAGAVGYSRMELGVHYPSDVLIGALVGIGSSFLMWKTNQWLTIKRKI